MLAVGLRLALDAARRAGCRIRPWVWTSAVVTASVLASTVACAGSVSSLRVLPALAAAGVSTITDMQTGYVFDRVLLPAASAVCVLALALGAMEAVTAGAILTGSILWALHAWTKGRGLGFGDVKLAALLGGAVGARGVAELLTIAFVTAAAVAVMLLLCGQRRRKDSMAFAPFLSAAACVVVVLQAQR